MPNQSLWKYSCGTIKSIAEGIRGLIPLLIDAVFVQIPLSNTIDGLMLFSSRVIPIVSIPSD